MGKGGGSDEQTIITELPEYAQPYFLRMMDRAETQSRVPYMRYPGERLAAMTPTTGTGIDMIRGMAGLEAIERSEDPYVDIPYQDIPEEFLAPPSPDPGQDDRIRDLEKRIAELSRPKPRRRMGSGERGGDAGSGAGYRDGGIVDLVKEGDRYKDPYGSRRYFQEGGEVVTPNLPAEVDLASQAAQGAVYDPNRIAATYADRLAETRQFDEAAAQQYMNPYITNVLDRLQERNIERYQRQARDIGAQAAAAGAFGGSRAYLAQQQAREDLAQQQADTEAQQMAAAFQQAGQLFGADEARRLQGLTTAGQQDLTAQQATEQARYGAAQQELGRAGQLAGIGQLRQTLGLQQADALIKAGQLEQQERQKAADLAYEEFLRERGYEEGQISFLSNILRGVPVQPNQQIATGGGGGFGLAQGLGLGIAGLGALEAAGIFG